MVPGTSGTSGGGQPRDEIITSGDATTIKGKEKEDRTGENQRTSGQVQLPGEVRKMPKEIWAGKNGRGRCIGGKLPIIQQE